ncbi:helix-turn-helix and ligand-binding sensor domain-containing protein [Aquimarina sp. 2201CG14-23]|uniref:helix-turn-helix and ligand-binding sensor domain-containing protein n=1 Tax=Aquimarina mycalae TaxID=3040073 RepID=UPI0024780545|nr:triple tyrosine motif-containing protein [Aquimarina sp. 2201CG14-23]MDH7446767.1 triple tyrosine motif-containing protein [Aquimarina sp. 2201CG14-23]
MKYNKRIFLFLCFLLSAIITAQELPPIETYFPDVYGGETQNWSVSQANNRYIYIANNKGLLEFNGSNWTLYPTPNETIMRSVKVVDDRIYTGFYMNFGFWKKNTFGTLEYTSLSDIIKDRLIEDEQFWYIVHLENRVLFQSLNRIYIYNSDNNQIDIIESDIAMLSMFNVNGVVYYQDINNGIFKIQKGQPTLIADLSLYTNDKVVTISETLNGILVLTETDGFFEISGNSIQKWNTPADEILKSSTIYSGIQLKDKSFALGTISNGVIYLSSKGEVIYHINQSNGLNNNTVLSLFEDVEENLWLALDNGVNCINLKSPIKIFNDDKGKIGTVYTSAIFNEYLYLGTNQGLFCKKFDTNEPFKIVAGTNGQVWNLFEFDNSLFCGHNSGTFIINEDDSRLISPIAGAWIFRPIYDNPNILLQGSYSGLSILEKNQGNWSLKRELEGFDYSARFIETYDDEIWVNHEYKGVFKIRTDKQFSKLLEITRDSSVIKGKNSIINRFKENLLYSHGQGVFQYNKEEKIFYKDSLLNQVFNVNDYVNGKLITDNTGRLWNFSDEDLSYIYPSQFSDNIKVDKIPIPRSLRKEMIGFENILHIKDDEYLLGTTDGYMILDLSKINLRSHNIIIDKVSVKQKDTQFKEVAFSDELPIFESNQNTVSFVYAIPEYDKYLISRFQYTLDGFYENWSDWTTKTNVVFENLPFGEYTFMVRTKTGNIVGEKVKEYKFIIDRPWYFSVLAIVIYSLTLLVLLLLMHRSYKRYYARQREKLVEENQKQLELRALESEREIMKLSNEKLTQDIESKNRELASSTMNIIKKNEILSTIKKELEKAESDRSSIKSVERIIDRNLNNKDDWKHFEEAFNNVDKDFLKKLKKKHNDLTPHDLRFCTYLRLNLSSKEIAPLLNISVRSVEIKRYRLRKKLKLKHSDNLVNYILEI